MGGPGSGYECKPGPRKRYRGWGASSDLGATISLLGGVFTRSGERSYLVGTGATPMLFAATDVRRLEDLGDGAGALFVFERAAENPVVQSEDMASASWTSVGTPTVSSNALTAPDGVVDADNITDNDAGTAERLRQTPTLGGVGNVVGAIFLFKDAITSRFPAIFFNGGGDFAAAANTSTGASSSVAPFTAPSNIDVQTIGSAWWRLAMRRTSVNGAAYDIAPAFANPIGTFDPAATGTTGMWGAYVQDAVNYAGRYIRTTTVPVAVGADTLLLSGIPAWFFTQAARFAQVSPDYANTDLVSGDIRWLFTIGGSSNGVRIRHDGANVLVEAVQGGVVRAASAAQVFAKRALLGPVRWDPPNGLVSVNGVNGPAGTAWSWTADAVRVGGIHGGSGSELDGRLSTSIERN